MITIGSHWQTGPWRSVPRQVVVEAIADAAETITFRFLDNDKRSTTSHMAFLRTYTEAPS